MPRRALWLGAILLAFMVAPALVPRQAVRERIASEYESAAALFGAARANAIAHRAHVAYEFVAMGTGLSAVMQRRYAQTLTLQLYSAMFRAGVMLLWMAYLGFFLLAALVDGLMQRRVRRPRRAVFAKPSLFAPASHAPAAIIVFPLAYLLFPFGASPWLVPVWALLMAASMALAAAPARSSGPPV